FDLLSNHAFHLTAESVDDGLGDDALRAGQECAFCVFAWKSVLNPHAADHHCDRDQESNEGNNQTENHAPANGRRPPTPRPRILRGSWLALKFSLHRIIPFSLMAKGQTASNGNTPGGRSDSIEFSSRWMVRLISRNVPFAGGHSE